MKGEIYGIGKNDCGQLGTGNTSQEYDPLKIDFFDGHKILQFFAGESHSVVLTGN